MKKPRILVVTIKKWNIENFKKFKKKFEKKFKIYLISNKNKLNKKKLKKIEPNFIFFIHWSTKVSNQITSNFNCYNFHMTDLPFGRGGSPLQNLLIRDIEKSKISLIKMNNNLDQGDIVYKEKFNLKGNAEQIYNSLSIRSFKIIEKIIEKQKLKFIKQKGFIKNFKRIKNNAMVIKKNLTLRNIYNQIRMRDAKTYEQTFVKIGKFKIYFKNAKIRSKIVSGKFEIF